MKIAGLDADGKLALPPDVLEDLGLEPGGEVRLRVEDGRLILENANPDDRDEEIVQAAIVGYLQNPGPTYSVEEVKPRLHARFEARARGRNAA